MADEPDLGSEVEKSRESAARLMETLARKLGTHRAVRNAANGIGRAAHYVQGHGLKDVAAEIERAVRSRPAASIVVAAAAGFVIGRALRSRWPGENLHGRSRNAYR